MRLIVTSVAGPPLARFFEQLHTDIGTLKLDLLRKRDEAGAIRLIRHHLARLDRTLDAARLSHGEYLRNELSDAARGFCRHRRMHG